MKVVCINNGIISGRKANLTYGKIYTALNTCDVWSSIGVQIKNDRGDTHFYNINRFCNIEYWRKIRIEEILNEQQ
jgi:hypothetical protein